RPNAAPAALAPMQNWRRETPSIGRHSNKSRAPPPARHQTAGARRKFGLAVLGFAFMPIAYAGEIRFYASELVPADWVRCDGQVMSKADNEGLFAALRGTYGGDGVSTFALPDLRGRVPLQNGTSRALGQAGGQERVTLALDQL